MGTATQGIGVWSALSGQIKQTIEAVRDGIVTVHGGGSSSASGVLWRPGIVVTVGLGPRRRDSLRVSLGGDPIAATLLGVDGGTDRLCHSEHDPAEQGAPQ